MTRLPLRPRSLAVALAAVLALAACGGGDDSDAGSAKSSSSASPSVEAASGEQAGTDDYTFTVPEGWTDITDRIPGFSPEVAYSAPRRRTASPPT